MRIPETSGARLHRCRRLAVLTLVCMGTAAGCLDEEPGGGNPGHVAGSGAALVLVGAKEPGADCSLEASVSGPFRTRGIVDLVLADQYTYAALVQLDPPAESAGQALQLVAATVEYDQDLPAFEPALGGSVGVANEGLTLVEFPLVSSDLLAAVTDSLPPRSPDDPAPSTEVRTQITLQAQTAAGTAAETAVAHFPLTFCKGCLLRFPIEAKLGQGNPNCRREDNPPQGGPCRVGQDHEVDCRLCRERKPIAERNDCEPF